MYQPYPYQIECLEAVEAVRNRGLNRALVVMASGLGKTVTMAFEAKRFRERGQGGRTLFLCHNNDILYQAKTTFEAVNGSEFSYGYFHGQEKQYRNVDFLFASFQTMENSKSLFDPNHFAYVIVDESHHSQAETYRSTINYFKPLFLLGATATPDRLDMQNIRDIFGPETYTLPLEEAMVQELVTPIDYRLLADEIVLERMLESEGKRVSLAELNRKVFIPRRDDEIAKIIAGHTSEFTDPRVMIFCTSIAHCDHLSHFIPGSFAIHSGIPKRERAIKLEMFRQGMISTVLVVDAFNEGVDIPQANVIVFLRSTTSKTIFLQQLGRGLRRSEGKDKVIALDFVGNCERIQMVHELWRSIEEMPYKPDNARPESNYTHSMTLNVDNIKFQETIVTLLNLIERVRRTMISEVENLLREYSPKNTIPANEVPSGSEIKLWWICSKCGHEWQASAQYRNRRGTGCPGCAGQVLTTANNLLLANSRLAQEYSDKNELPADKVYVSTTLLLWWKCATCGHEWQATGHRRHKAGAGCPGCAGRVVTKTNNLLALRPDLAKEYSDKNELPADQVLAGGQKSKRWWICSKCGHEWQATASHRICKGTGCPKCCGGSNILTQTNNLLVARPDLAKEYSARNELPADQICAKTNRKLWWKCSVCNHEWQAKGHKRCSGNGCPRCAHKVVTQTNNLLVARPDLAKEYSARNELPADQVRAQTDRKLWWKCSVCNHEWEATGRKRNKGTGCPICRKKKVPRRTI
ncbi:MAG: zinc-ribbon domain-containing protein [Patescibacteria group bacterium]|jgi:superfamily II DNA or RNA helicase/DNA-directed RNA polymerase subunit RPC12/RpoP